MQRKQFFVRVAQAARVVDYANAVTLGELEHHRVVEKLRVERRILACEHDVDFAQVAPVRGAQRKPVVRVVAHLQRGQACERNRVAQRQVALVHVQQLVTAPLRFEQQGQSRVLFDVDRADRVHQHGDRGAHRVVTTALARGVLAGFLVTVNRRFAETRSILASQGEQPASERGLAARPAGNFLQNCRWLSGKP